MAIGYTRDEILKLGAQFEAFLPSEPALTDWLNAPRVRRLAFAGVQLGILVHVDAGPYDTPNLFMNPIVARTLLEGIAMAGKVHDWWPRIVDKEVPLAFDHIPQGLDGAVNVRSLRTADVPEGILFVCGAGFGELAYFLAPNFAAALAWAIHHTADRAGWWDHNLVLQPTPTV